LILCDQPLIRGAPRPPTLLRCSSALHLDTRFYGKARGESFMKKILLCAALLLLLWPLPGGAQVRYSTGGVSNYPANPCGGPNLPLSVPEARDFQFWYNRAGMTNVTRWENGDVWGSDFRDASGGANNDRDPSGGSDIAQAYFFTGHGICET